MAAVFKCFQRFAAGKTAATAIEYALMVSLIAGVVITAVLVLSGTVHSMWEDSAEKIGSAMTST